MKLLSLLLVCAASTLCVVPVTEACGDKFLVKLDRTLAPDIIGTAKRGAKILVFVPNESRRALPSADLQLLAGVGHQVEVCDSATKCVEAVKSGEIEVLVGDYRDLEALPVAMGDFKAHVIPTASKASRKVRNQVKAQYGRLYDTGAPIGKFLKIVDKVTSER